MKKCFFYSFIAFAALSCSRYPADVRNALEIAGENRTELEKVLKHYGKRPIDRLKLQSAYFLIANMPYQYTVVDARLDSFKTYVLNDSVVLRETLWDTYAETHKPVKEKIKHDIHCITSDFLIRNIDFSFRVWQETPWCKYYSFEDFCEEILPYRLSHEPLEHWKEKYHSIFRPVIDSMVYSNCKPEEICLKLLQHVREEGWIFAWVMTTHGAGASFMLENRFGGCKELADFITCVMRSVGIPSGIDGYVQNPNGLPCAHFWNYMRNAEGNNVAFDYYDDFQLSNGVSMKRKLGKVYRECFALQNESLPVKYKNKYKPLNGRKDAFQKDVSINYFPNSHVSVRLENPGLFRRKDLIYLCTFNNKDWIPIAWTFPKKGIAEFRNVEPGILYQLRLIEGSRNLEITKPFIFHSNDSIQFPEADMNNLQLMTLGRIYRIPEEWPAYVNRAINGKFQGANLPDFSDSITLHTIQKSADMKFEDVMPNHPGKFKYFRYLSANNGFNNMADVSIFSEENQLQGKVIGTEGSFKDNARRTKHAVFDNDPFTYFSAIEPDSAWAGLELNKAHRIDHIRYIFRNDDNDYNIRKGDSYEFFYMKQGEWQSVGCQTADTTELLFEKVPSNTLYRIHNHSRSKYERPFTYEDGIQVWW